MKSNLFLSKLGRIARTKQVIRDSESFWWETILIKIWQIEAQTINNQWKGTYKTVIDR